nr:alkane hydroxylase MAH1-like [Aegilops tauschii subsp. strangulata]
MPTNWPVVGSVSTITVNAGRMHEWLTEFLSVAPGMSHVARGPWGSPVDILLTANPADVAHVFTTNFGNYPKGEEFAVLAHALLSDSRFRAAVATSTARKLDEGLVPLLDGVAAGGAVVDLQDMFMRLTFDLTAMFIFGRRGRS